jgi:hypothetical protein
MASATANPQPVTLDWDEIRALHVKGMSLKDLSDRYGISYTALRSRSSREKWCNTVAMARNTVTQVATEALAKSATSWISKLDTAVHAALDNVMAKGLHKLGLRDLQVALDCVEKSNRVARLNYGLDSENASRPRVTVNLAVMARGADHADHALPAFDTTPIVDVDTVTSDDMDASVPSQTTPSA